MAAAGTYQPAAGVEVMLMSALIETSGTWNLFDGTNSSVVVTTHTTSMKVPVNNTNYVKANTAAVWFMGVQTK